ncbi:MAG: histidine biosynthesis bifunctional protein HisB [Cyclobacteriaceae bacterium]|nr:MAG: histidine biosynthesis bifunctional protein HisB [Cyclobacteriaceae bacterium]
MKKVLFIDRDGTIIAEPADEQVDSLEKLSFLPGALVALHHIATKLSYELVMVTNQDGLGTDSFPENQFWPAHNKMLDTLKSVGVSFSDILIDRTFESEGADTRKPGTGMLSKYLDGSYDLPNSFVIGDRVSDIQLASNLGAKAIFIGDQSPEAALCTTDWNLIYDYLAVGERTGSVERKTNETDISIQLNLNGTGVANNQTGISFFDHMLDQLARHGQLDLAITVNGDLEVDEHHTIEDTALALGEAFNKALGNKRGIERYGYCLPMDDCLAQVAIDFGGRNWLEWDAEFKREMIGKMPTEMFFHFFKSFTDTARCNLNIKAEGTNEHHKIEAIFKAFAKSIKMAVRQDPLSNDLPSTKGVL